MVNGFSPTLHPHFALNFMKRSKPKDLNEFSTIKKLAKNEKKKKKQLEKLFLIISCFVYTILNKQRTLPKCYINK